VQIAVALLPVLLFLVLLTLLDSFKLVRPRALLLAIAAGAVSAVVAAAANGALLDHAGLDLRFVSRYLAPAIEEALKAAWVVWLIRRQRIGFLVDAAIYGFAVGAGFALYENVDYLEHIQGAGAALWFVRGCGTALLHGATTATFAMLGKDLTDRRSGASALLPGLAAAVAVHSLYNHFVLPPVVGALLLLLTLPLLLMAVFDRSERSTRSWLAEELDGDLDLLGVIVAGGVGSTRVGAYLQSLRSRFQGEVVADMLCLLQVQLELKIRAKGILMAREAGLDLPVGDDVRAGLIELRYLEGSVGRTGLLAMKPILRTSSRDLWQLGLLRESGEATAPRA
jgi:RsiW-degrading membrane proteinase PrsW (M82 family)